MAVLTERQQRGRKNARAFKRERKRIGRIKAVLPVRNRKYLDWIRGLPCLLCRIDFARNIELFLAVFHRYGVPVVSCQLGRSEAAHVGTRGMRQKCSDAEAIPLCAHHHRTAPDAHHRLGRKFWEHHSLDRDKIIAQLRASYERERAA